MANHGEAALLQITSGEKHNALPRIASIAVTVGENADFGVHSFVENFVGLKLHFGEVDGAGGGWRYPNSVGSEGCFFDFYGFKFVLFCIRGFVGDKFKEQLREA
jgi:hypothetical protein